MPGKFTIKNYDTQGGYTSTGLQTQNTKFKQAQTSQTPDKTVNGIPLYKCGDGKINKTEFKRALIDYYRDTCGNVGNPDKNASLFDQQKYQEFTNFVNNLEIGDVNIDNDSDFIDLLNQKAKELKERMESEKDDNGTDETKSPIESAEKALKFEFGI